MPGTPSPMPGLPASQAEGTGANESGASYVRQYLEFHNPRPEAVLATIRFDLAGLPPALALNFRLSRNAKPQSVTGAKLKTPGCFAWPRRLVSWLWWKLSNCWDGRLAANDCHWQARPTKLAAAAKRKSREIFLPPGSKMAADLVLRHDERLAPGDVYHLDVLQLVKGAVVGGATLILPIAGAKPSQTQSPNWENEREIAGRTEMERRV